MLKGFSIPISRRDLLKLAGGQQILSTRQELSLAAHSTVVLRLLKKFSTNHQLL